MKVVFSVGGSIVAPEALDGEYIRKLSGFLSELSQENDVAVVVGGGRPARQKIEEARSGGANEAACDLVGIIVSRTNARAVAEALGDEATAEPPKSIVEAAEAFESGCIPVMGGTEPGHSTDAVAAILAELVGADLLVNASNVDYVYDSDPKKNPDAKKLEEIKAAELVKLVSAETIKAGGYALIDFTAAKIIERSKIKTVFVDGRDIENMQAAVSGREFKGTTVN